METLRFARLWQSTRNLPYALKVVVAIDSMKGCLSSREAGEAVQEAVLQSRPDAEVVCLPVSDGGEGFLDAIQPTGQWARISLSVYDPLMRPVVADYLLSGHRAVIEMAQASGLQLLKENERNPFVATSYGTGQLIADSVQHGAWEIIVGLGGSATSDCGRGVIQALEDAFGSLDAFNEVHFTIATDVENPLLGPDGAVYTFARQKGATEEMLPLLESRSESFVTRCIQKQGFDCSCKPGAGAAGGLGYALMQFLGAERKSGCELMLDAAHIDTLLSDADLIITGEGHADRQTLMGKLPVGILRRAQKFGIPTWLIAGKVSDADRLLAAGFSRVIQISPEDMPLAEAMRPDVARRNIQAVMCEKV